jgi:hypothetical protein
MTARHLRDLLNAYYNPADPLPRECGWPWWDVNDRPHSCGEPIGHNDGVHEIPPDVQARLEQVVQAELTHRRETRCSICGWVGAHSTVCPFGPLPTKDDDETFTGERYGDPWFGRCSVCGEGGQHTHE